MDKPIIKSVIVKAEPEQAFRVWENFENFPIFMENIKSVTTTRDEHLSHWVVSGPMGKEVEWTAELTTYEPGKRIGWNTKDMDGDVTTSGQVTFADLSHGETEVTVTMQYEPKGGKAGEIVAKIFAKPEEMLEEDLYNFKRYIESSNSPQRM